MCSVVTKLGFHLGGCVKSIMGACLHKIACYIMDYHYMMLRPVSGILWSQLGSLGLSLYYF